VSGAQTPPSRTVRCPGCGLASEYSPANRFRPFCCQRCKEGDFGAWAAERYRVETTDPLDPLADGSAPSVH
jgi:endogenous inhibitor of DNA gyrase (YacG/DUF329 family)